MTTGIGQLLRYPVQLRGDEDGSNYSRWCYKPFEDLIQPARATDDHNKRIELYKQAQVVMHDQAPALIVAHS